MFDWSNSHIYAGSPHLRTASSQDFLEQFGDNRPLLLHFASTGVSWFRHVSRLSLIRNWYIYFTDSVDDHLKSAFGCSFRVAFRYFLAFLNFLGSKLLTPFCLPSYVRSDASKYSHGFPIRDWIQPQPPLSQQDAKTRWNCTWSTT
jgi:hypothetical protein